MLTGLISEQFRKTIDKITDFQEKGVDNEKPIEDVTYTIDTNFKLPIVYLDKSMVYPITPVVATDLELISITDSSNQPCMYDYLFQPKHVFAKHMITEWKKQYTTNTDYLVEQQQCIANMVNYKEIMQDEEESFDNANDIMEIWNDVKNNDFFLEQYGYMEWDYIKYLNTSTPFLQALSMVNIISPILSLIVPFLFLLFPFIILKLQNIPVTFSVYMDVLKEIAKNHFIGKTLMTMDSITIEKVLYCGITFAFYALQIYQNVQLCKRFYKNMNKINESLCKMRKYIKYSLCSMETFNKLNGDKPHFMDFCKETETHCIHLRTFHEELLSIRPFDISISKLTETGHLLKCFYELYDNAGYTDALRYSMGFEGYIDNLLGVYENLNVKLLSFAEFDISTNCIMKNQYYPPLLNENPVKNDCAFDKNMIITSPNAGGKTTMLKTTTLNIIFTQQVGCGFYSSCILNPYTHIHSYLNIPDTSGRDSLFQAESRRCKEILDIIKEYDDPIKYRHFCLFDELYSGTNPAEASKAAYAFLLYLSKIPNVQFMLTTHYVSVCNKFKQSKHIRNYKMIVENLPDGSLHYTYKMKKGISRIQGAVKILKDMEYPDEIIRLCS